MPKTDKDIWIIVFLIGLMALSVISGEIYFRINKFKNHFKNNHKKRKGGKKWIIKTKRN